jgi:hypothetical protein
VGDVAEDTLTNEPFAPRNLYSYDVVVFLTNSEDLLS